MGINKKGNMVKIRRKFRDNGNNLISATRPIFEKEKKPRVPRENRLVKGNTFKKSINLYWIKRKYEKNRWRKINEIDNKTTK